MQRFRQIGPAVRVGAYVLRRPGPASGVQPSANARLLRTSAPAAQLDALEVLADAAANAEKNAKNSEGSNGDGKKRDPRRRAKRPDSEQKKESAFRRRVRETTVRASQTAIVMTSGLAMLGFAGLVYHRLYRRHTLHKMNVALDKYDPALEMSIDSRLIESSSVGMPDNEALGLSSAGTGPSSDPAQDGSAEASAKGTNWVHSNGPATGDGDDGVDEKGWVVRPQQRLIDDIVSGRVSGRYFVLVGEKGTGKTSMLLHAIKKVKGHNVVVMDAHADPEIFRQRLGKCLSFEFHEDYWGGLFSLRGPRENTFLDIERVFTVLEEVAVQRYHKYKRPLTLVINSAHLIREDEDGRKLLTLLQQKAESLSGSGIGTIMLNSDDYWLLERLNRQQTRMETISVQDLSRPESFRVLRRLRKQIRNAEVSDAEANTVYWLVGGRPQHLAAVAAAPDMIVAGQRLIDREKQWFLNQCGLLGATMDDDVMDYGKFSVAAMTLARELVRMHETEGADLVAEDGTYTLPRVTLWQARQIMKRPDFIREYDHLNIFTLDPMSRVKPDSVVMMHAFREIVMLPGFDELLDGTADRVDDIESLGRTREINLKDLGGGGGRSKGAYVFDKGRLVLESPEDLETENADSDDPTVVREEEQFMVDSEDRYFWKQRISELDTRENWPPRTEAKRQEREKVRRDERELEQKLRKELSPQEAGLEPKP